jgi:hypothetical protein
MDSLLSFPVGLFHPLQTCRFIPTLSEYAVIRPEHGRRRATSGSAVFQAESQRGNDSNGRPPADFHRPGIVFGSQVPSHHLARPHTSHDQVMRI